MKLLSVDSTVDNLSKSTVQYDKAVDKVHTEHKSVNTDNNGTQLAVADKLYTQGTSLSRSIDENNTQMAVLEIADKSMIEQSKILDIIKTKFMQATRDTTNADGREAIQKDINKLLIQLENIVSQVDYNEKQFTSNSKVLSAMNTHIFQLEANVNALQDDTQKYQEIIDSMLSSLEQNRLEIKSSQNQVHNTVMNLIEQTSNKENGNSSNKIDYAFESESFHKSNVVSRLGEFVLAQANIDSKSTLGLLN